MVTTQAQREQQRHKEVSEKTTAVMLALSGFALRNCNKITV